MLLVADLHIHSRYSRACSQSLSPETLQRGARLKGLDILGTGDLTHPAWLAELREKLTEAEPGLYALRPGLELEVPATCRGRVRFLLQGEVSCIYKADGRVRKAHHLIFVPDFAAAGRLGAALEKLGNIRSDGRPILGLDSRRLLALVKEASPQAHLVPAHAWTPHFSVFGSRSGFDSLEECFGDMAGEIFALETGLSSDPEMNWRLSALDRVALISNSDAHSPENLGREANVFDAEPSYTGIFAAIRGRDPARFPKTLEFYPELGKYHVDGHRACGRRLEPEETLRRGGLCPDCGKPVTVGVLSRVRELADRLEGRRPPGAPDFERLIPLREVLGQVLDVGPGSRRVAALYGRLLERFGPELVLLRQASLAELRAEGHERLAEALERMRSGRVECEPGFDGQFGRVRLLPALVS